LGQDVVLVRHPALQFRRHVNGVAAGGGVTVLSSRAWRPTGILGLVVAFLLT
jgi:hypothetical protein